MSAYARAIAASVRARMNEASPEIMAVLRAAAVWRDSPDELSDKALAECTRRTNALAEAFDGLPADLQKLLR